MTSHNDVDKFAIKVYYSEKDNAIKAFIELLSCVSRTI